ncbi:peptidase M13 [Paucilactobacillus hokkaidonensis JCM 18461]|uniref:Peptidase M13 n=2 Tax=Paucilactobacillus hokkaidonensis TaxID=1193095 RepID=A0A0A1GUN3_9LACO|nr:M13-type metalloendopeptidase [Paucilactobacillus hokkaidonensis]KRO09841.1 endopeptidase O [Paucilactobacillus hokkaidonensis]BAP84729.1 peptidase M13 [Paucilactobacillus hokkaidonensis JCM 18461]
MAVNEKLIKSDLYEAVNGEWIKTAKIPDDKPATGGFNDLVDEIDKLLMGDFDQMVDNKIQPDNDMMKEFIKLYQLASDFDRREQEKTEPLDQYLTKIDGLQSFSDYQAIYVDWIKHGLPSPIAFDIDADMKNARVNALFTAAPNLILPDKTYYEDGNQSAPALIAVFSKMMTELLSKLNYSDQQTKQIIEQGLKFDRSLVPYVKSAEESADYSKMYNPKTNAEFVAYSSTLDLGATINDLVGAQPEKIIVTEPKYFEALDKIINDDHFAEFKSWLIIQTVRGLSSYLSEDFRVISGQYSRALSGSKAPMKQKKFAYYLAAGTFDQVVGDYYGHKYFGETAKNDVHQMVEKMISVYQHRLANNTWLSKETRDKAVLKLSKLGIQVGFPDKIDALYQKLHVDSTKTLLANELIATKVAREDMFAKWNQPVDRNQWEMSAATVNAYYHPFRNIIVFPAAILQAPFYSLKQSSSENYGGIGAVIAHEISHAFDNNGALFDEYGNLNNWWTTADLDHFKALSQSMIAEFDGLEYAGQKVNGKLTVSENIADAGGLSCALEAAESEADVDTKAFFINWSTIWRMKATEQYMQLLLSIDVHAPAKLRANVQVKNLPEFYHAFDIQPGDPMYLEPEKRVNIW